MWKVGIQDDFIGDCESMSIVLLGNKSNLIQESFTKELISSPRKLPYFYFPRNIRNPTTVFWWFQR